MIDGWVYGRELHRGSNTGSPPHTDQPQHGEKLKRSVHRTFLEAGAKKSRLMWQQNGKQEKDRKWAGAVFRNEKLDVRIRYLRVRWRSVLYVELQSLQSLFLLDEVRRVQSHVLMEDLKVLTNRKHFLRRCYVFDPQTPYLTVSIFYRREGRCVLYLFRCCFETFVPLASLCVHVQSGHDVHTDQLIRCIKKNQTQNSFSVSHNMTFI